MHPHVTVTIGYRDQGGWEDTTEREVENVIEMAAAMCVEVEDTSEREEPSCTYRGLFRGTPRRLRILRHNEGITSRRNEGIDAHAEDFSGLRDLVF
jgi:hypothetical protein